MKEYPKDDTDMPINDQTLQQRKDDISAHLVCGEKQLWHMIKCKY